MRIVSFTVNDEAFNGRVGIGTYITNDFRIGVESGYAAFSGSFAGSPPIDVNTWDILAVAYYDFNNETSFTPFLGFGVGLAQRNIDIGFGSGDSKTTNHLALQVGSGIGYAISENIELLATHSFQYSVAAELVDDLDVSAYQNRFNVGLRYSF